MPKTELQQAERVLGQVTHLLSRFESVRQQNGGAAGGVPLREFQKLSARMDSQFSHISTLLNGFARAQRLLGNDAPIFGAENFASDTSPRRSQDEITHLFSRFIASGFDNF